MRTGNYTRKTKETEVSSIVNLDGTGIAHVETGIKFLDHMLTCFSTHSLIDINVKSRGDLKHHIVEDTAIVLGESLYQAIQQDKRITRFSDSIVPMDDCLAMCSVDLSGRPYSVIDLGLENPMTEDITNEDLIHFFESLANNIKANIHIQVKYGKNDHHRIEASFKALARCIRLATTIDPRQMVVPSSKGVL